MLNVIMLSVMAPQKWLATTEHGSLFRLTIRVEWKKSFFKINFDTRLSSFRQGGRRRRRRACCRERERADSSVAKVIELFTFASDTQDE
jgi:hypothetical protein